MIYSCDFAFFLGLPPLNDLRLAAISPKYCGPRFTFFIPAIRPALAEISFSRGSPGS